MKKLLLYLSIFSASAIASSLIPLNGGGGGGSGIYVKKAGDTMTGALLIGVTGNALQVGNPPISLTGTGLIGAGVVSNSSSTNAGFMAVSPTSNPIFEGIGYGNATTRFRGYRALGDDPTNPQAIAGAGGIAQLEGFGYDGSAFVQGGGVFVRSTGAWSTTDHRSNVQLLTTLQGASTFVVGLQLGDLGDVTIGPSGSSVTHPVNGNMSVSGLTPNTALIADASKVISSSVTTDTELGYLSGATANIQSQLDAKASFPVDLTTDVTGVLPSANGGTGSNGLPFNSVPYYSSLGQYEADNPSLNYDPTSHRLNLSDLSITAINDSTSKSIGSVGGSLTGVTAISSDVFRIQQALDGDFNYIQGPSYLSQLNGVTTSLVSGGSISFSVNGNSVIDLLKADEVGPQIGVSANIGTFEGRTITPTLGGTIGQITLDKISPTVSGLNAVTGNVIGKAIYLSGVTANNIAGIEITTDNNVATGTDSRPKSISANSQSFTFANSTKPLSGVPASGNDSINVAFTNYTVDTAMSYGDVIGFAQPLNLTVTGSGSIPASLSGIGIQSVAYADLLGIQAGVTVPDFGGAIAVVVNTFGGGGETGGHLQRFSAFKSLGILPGGGSNTFGDGIHFWAADGMCSQVLGNCYSLKSDDTGATLYQSGPLQLPSLTASTVPYLNASKVLVSSSVTPTELGYLSGVTQAIQTQINNIVSGSGFVLKAGDTMTGALLIGVTNNALQVANPPGTISGALPANVVATSGSTLAGFLAVSPTSNPIIEGASYGNSTTRFRAYRASGNDPTTPAAATGAGGIAQLEAFAHDGTSFTQGAAVNLRTTGTWSGSDHRTNIQLNNVLQGTTTQVTSLQVGDLGDITIGPSGATVTHPVNGNMSLSGVTASRALYADASKVIRPSVTTDTELGYVNGVTSAIQTQLNSKNVTTTTDNLRVEAFEMSATCTTGTCSLGWNTAGVSSVAFNATGDYTITLTSGCSSNVWCNLTNDIYTACTYVSNTSTTYRCANRNLSATNTNTRIGGSCFCKR